MRATLAMVAAPLLAACAASLLSFAAAPCRAANKPRTFVDIRVDAMAPGAVRFVRWKGRSFVIVRTTQDMLDDLRAQTSHTWSERPIAEGRPAFFVFSRSSSPRGCAVVHAPAGAARYAPERPWLGGFYDPCRFGEWDYAGRTIRQYADQEETLRRPDLDVPPFELNDPSTLRLGASAGGNSPRPFARRRAGPERRLEAVHRDLQGFDQRRAG